VRTKTTHFIEDSSRLKAQLRAKKKKTRSTDSIILAEVVPAETGEVGSVGISGWVNELVIQAG